MTSEAVAPLTKDPVAVRHSFGTMLGISHIPYVTNVWYYDLEHDTWRVNSFSTTYSCRLLIRVVSDWPGALQDSLSDDV